MNEQYTTNEEIRINFFKALKISNTNEIISNFQNYSIKPWLLIEEDDYTGILQ
jgi:hypothetical protein